MQAVQNYKNKTKYCTRWKEWDCFFNSWNNCGHLLENCENSFEKITKKMFAH